MGPILAADPVWPLVALALALLVDAGLGDPDWLWRRLPHPVVVIGRLIGGLDRLLNRANQSDVKRRLAGVAAIALLTTAAAGFGWGLAVVLAELPGGWLVEGLVIAVLLAGRSLIDHVAAVAGALEREGLPGGRRAVARIVGRDPDSLDEPAVARASIESLAENLSDGLVAPLFWTVVAGLPGLIAYKAINTADSMIGHRNERYRAFGWAAARLDDGVNLVPARLTAGLLVLAALLLPGAKAGGALRAVARDAGRHRSPNAGWPEAATAGALGLALAGPRRYGAQTVDDAWMNPDGSAQASAADIRRAIRLAASAWGLIGFAVLVALAGALWSNAG